MCKGTTTKSSKTAAASKKPVAKHSKKGGFKPNAMQEAILQTLGKLRAINKEQPTRDMVMHMSKNASKKPGYEKNCGILKKQGLLNYPGSKTDKLVELTEEGIAYVGVTDPSDMTNDVFHDCIKEMISKKAGLILDALVDGKVHNREKTAKALGYDMNKLSGFDKDLSKMTTLGFLDKTKTTLQLTKACFPMNDDE